ncbi:L-ascorbate oxidase [Orchesella cincta]|uniref:L-ascorbate oxidase n=1 Tax=Orchesella cincta TaxID=48709 RepID=A0A1D2N418_ORCCI|nr:L-ascorbate oxidase [Orchesella cincta]
MKSVSKVSLLALPILLVFGIAAVNSKTVKHTFRVSYISGLPDGVLTTSILGINGKYPGPLIEAEVGDVLEVTVINKIQDGQNVTLHWHGLHQRGTPFQDGPSQITQCPLKEGSTQVYTFPLLLPGTYWYHSHVNSQYTEGLWGSLIVRGTPEVWQELYDEEILITVNDWYHTSAKQNEEWFLRPESGGAPPYPFSVLMNGVGRYPCGTALKAGRLCVSYSQVRPVFKVQPRKTYRLRLINTSGWVAFNFTISGHTLTPIEVDGIDLAANQPVHHAIFIGAGQRYSFLLKADAGVVGDEFLIRASLRKEFLFTLAGNINPAPEAVINEVTGVIKYANVGRQTYSSSPLVKPSFEQFDHSKTYRTVETWSTMDFLTEMETVPFDAVPAPPNFDTEKVVNIIFQNDENGLRRGSFNGHPFELPTGKPALGKLVDGIPIPEATSHFNMKYGDIVQVVINNPELGPHPIHLHGHHFWVVGMGHSGDGSYDPLRHQLNLNGHRRDTVLVKEKSWLVIRFRADNPGVWLMHCHIDWHMLSGMAMVFVEAPELASSIRVPDEARKVCADHNVFI